MRTATSEFGLGFFAALMLALMFGAPFDPILLAGAAIAGSGFALGRILIARAARFA